MNTISANVALIASSLTSSDNEGEKIPYRTLNDKEEECVLDALRVLHGVVATADRSKSRTSLPSWAECGLEQYESVLDRTFAALKRKASADAARIVNRAKQGVEADIDAAREAEAIAFAEWDALSPTLKARFPYKAPKHVKVTISSLVRHFPKGWNVASCAKVLRDVGYVIEVPTSPNPSGKGRPVSDTNSAYILADRVVASTIADGSTLPHGNGERVNGTAAQMAHAAK